MRKYFIFVLSALLVLGFAYQARAEQSSSSASGKVYVDNQVFTIAYNSGALDISGNSVVVLDVGNSTRGSTMGSYIDTTTTADNKMVFGVADGTIGVGSTGRVCIRGPHLVNIRSSMASAIASGDIITSSTVVGAGGEGATSDGTASGQLGRALEAGTITGGPIWVYIDPKVHQ